MEEPLSSELIARYLASEANDEERAIVDAWAAASPANAADLAHMREVWTARSPGQVWDVDRAWKKVDERLSVPGRGISLLRPPKRRAASMALRIAAVLTLVAGLGYGWRTYSNSLTGPSQVFTTGVGERRTVDLADGTHVLMGPVSELRVSAKFRTADRRVDLKGEAWFEVKHDDALSFQVYAFGIVTEDLGTSFVVRALPSDSVVHVVVVEGSASVRLMGTSLKEGATLNARDAVQLDAKTLKAHVVRNIAVEPLVAWRTGAVEFEEVPLRGVAVEMLRWYGVSMRFEPPSLSNRLLSYKMPTNNLTEATNVLSASLGVHIERKGDTLIVR
jgi:ferric-dicitrate binding protein FerR (iron transport regulator)